MQNSRYMFPRSYKIWSLPFFKTPLHSSLKGSESKCKVAICTSQSSTNEQQCEMNPKTQTWVKSKDIMLKKDHNNVKKKLHVLIHVICTVTGDQSYWIKSEVCQTQGARLFFIFISESYVFLNQGHLVIRVCYSLTFSPYVCNFSTLQIINIFSTLLHVVILYYFPFS